MLIAAGALARLPQGANATPEGSITYSVSQSPAAGAVLQVGEVLTFTVDIDGDGATTPSAFSGPVVFDLRRPTNMAFASVGGQVGNIVTSCADNIPQAGYVRCVIGNGNSIPAGALQSGTNQEIVLNFTADAASATTLYSTGDIQALFTDSLSGFRNAGDTPDNAAAGDLLDGSIGGFTVVNILGANANMSVASAAVSPSVFEGALSTVTVTFSHALGAFATTQPLDVTVTNADVQTGSVNCPGGTGVASVVGNIARCTGSTVADGSALSFTVRSQDTATGADMVATLSAPSLGLSVGEAASAAEGTARLTVPVVEVGLQTVSLPAPGAAVPPWVVGGLITVCTAAVSPDDPNDAAAGLAQDPSLVAGTSTLVPVTPLAAGDFAVTGPFGPVAFTYLASSALNCGIGQSGVQFATSFAGTYSVTAYYNGDTTSGSTVGATRGSNVLALTAQDSNPVPSVSSLAPSSSSAGGPAFNLTVNGSGYVADSVVRWNGSDRITSYVSSTQLTASILVGDVAAQGSAAVSVFSPGPGGGLSGTAAFTITSAPNPAPLISSLSPSVANAGSPGFTITVYGSSFVPGAVVRWNGTDRSTTFLSAGQLTAEVLTADLSAPASANVTVFNPSPGGGTSLVATFTVSSAPNPSPSISSLSPTGAATGSAAFTLTVNGSNFVAGTVIRWNGSDRPTTYIGATQLSATIPATDVAGVGTALVRVFTPAPGGGLSSATAFAVDNGFPAIGGLSPATVSSGGASFALVVTGSGFLPGSVVRWNGADRITSYLSPTQLSASISSVDIAVSSTAAVTVYNGPPGGGASAAVPFVVTNPAPTITSLSPDAASAASGAFTLTVVGASFAPGAIVRWDGADRTTTYISATQLTAAIPGSDMLATRVVSVTVVNPVPGGGTSAGASFTVGNALVQPSAQLTLTSPSGATVGRSRLRFTASTGSLSATSVAFIIRRKTDNKHWDPATQDWIAPETQAAAVSNGDGTWSLPITGASRRRFADTEVIVTVRAVVVGLPYRSETTRNIVVR